MTFLFLSLFILLICFIAVKAMDYKPLNSLWTDSMCLDKISFVEQPNWQSSQLKSFLPSWIVKIVCSSGYIGKTFSYTSCMHVASVLHELVNCVLSWQIFWSTCSHISHTWIPFFFHEPVRYAHSKFPKLRNCNHICRICMAFHDHEHLPYDALENQSVQMFRYKDYIWLASFLHGYWYDGSNKF